MANSISHSFCKTYYCGTCTYTITYVTVWASSSIMSHTTNREINNITLIALSHLALHSAKPLNLLLFSRLQCIRTCANKTKETLQH